MRGITRFIITTIFVMTAVLAGYASVAQAGGYVPPQISCTVQAFPTFGVSPLKVDFTANVIIGTAETYSWDFGDGITSSLKQTTHTYANPGSYTAKLTVTNINGAKALSCAIITVLEPIADTGIVLTAEASGYKGVGVPGNAVDNNVNTAWVTPFNSDRTAIKWLTLDCGGVYELSSISIWWDSYGRVANYDIQISEDGQVWTNCYTDLNTISAYSTPYITAYSLSGKARFIRIYIKQVYTAYFLTNVFEVYIYGEPASSNQIPTADASASPTSGIMPLQVAFTGSGTDPDGTIASYSWNFGDGATSTEQNTVHTYNNSGNYNITLIVTDDDGATASDTVSITVNEPPNQPPTATANAAPIAGEAPLEVMFTGGGVDPDGAIIGYGWGFGDGQTSGEQNPSHTYNNPGNYTVTLTTTDDDGATGTDSISITVAEHINEAPTAAAAASPASGDAPLTVQFTATVSDVDGTIALYSWVFGDGHTSTEQNPLYTYHTAGTYNAALTVTDDDGASASGTVVVTVTEPVNQPPTGTVEINNGASSTNSREVTLTLSAQDAESSVTEMQFSSDGLNWTEPEEYATTKAWVLSAGDGEKTVYVRFKDGADNWSDNVSDSIILDTSTLIGPDGGVVFSPDGHIKIIIPPGALSQPTAISIQSADPAAFDQSDIPVDYELAIAGEFNPVGLVFNIPAQVVFYLDSPGIPGTPVSLYLYHKLEGTFVSTDKTSSIAADGITVSFSVDHFSTYGALQNMISAGAPIGGGVNIPTPDLFTGAYTHDIAIEIPKGRKDMHPNLSLQYRSGNPNTWVGQGWQLNPGYIQRSTKQGVPKYDDQKDTFIFVSQSQSTELAHLIDNLYQAKVEGGFIKYYKENDDSWYLLTKDGNKMYFGQDLNSKQTTSKGSFAWYLTQAVDPNGNYVEFNYTKDAGKVYLDSISYTGPYPKYEVRFYLEDRADKHSSYISGEECAIRKRLDYIEVYCDSGKVWTYTMEYEFSPDTDRSLLKSITQKGSDGASYPAKEFGYQRRK